MRANTERFRHATELAGRRAALGALCATLLSACSLHSLDYLDNDASAANPIDSDGALGTGSSASAGALDEPANGGAAAGGTENSSAGRDSGEWGSFAAAGSAGKPVTGGQAGAPAKPELTQLTNNTRYSLHPGHDTTKCADDRGRNLFNGASVIVYACNGQAGQGFVALDRGNGYFAFKNALNGRCLEVAGASSAANATVDLYTCGDADNQLWLVVATSAGLFKLVAKHSGMALGVQGAQSTASDQSLVQNPYDDSLDLQWRFVATP